MASDHGEEADAPLFAVSAEFCDAEALLEAIHALRGRKLGRLDAYSPMPIDGMSRALALHGRGVQPVAAIGAAAGFIGAIGMCVYATGYAYVFDIGGRPAISLASSIIPSIASALMLAAACTLIGMMVLNRLPRLNHPAFNIPDFTRASQDRFFLAIESAGLDFDADAAEHALRGLRHLPVAICRVKR